jgi:hypothetical protein
MMHEDYQINYLKSIKLKDIQVDSIRFPIELNRFTKHFQTVQNQNYELFYSFNIFYKNIIIILYFILFKFIIYFTNFHLTMKGFYMFLTSFFILYY